MVKRLKLNEKLLRAAETRPGVSYQIFDSEVIGFAVRVLPAGARTFSVDYRHALSITAMPAGSDAWPSGAGRSGA